MQETMAHFLERPPSHNKNSIYPDFVPPSMENRRLPQHPDSNYITRYYITPERIQSTRLDIRRAQGDLLTARRRLATAEETLRLQLLTKPIGPIHCTTPEAKKAYRNTLQWERQQNFNVHRLVDDARGDVRFRNFEVNYYTSMLRALLRGHQYRQENPHNEFVVYIRPGDPIIQRTNERHRYRLPATTPDPRFISWVTSTTPIPRGRVTPKFHNPVSTPRPKNVEPTPLPPRIPRISTTTPPPRRSGRFTTPNPFYPSSTPSSLKRQRPDDNDETPDSKKTKWGKELRDTRLKEEQQEDLNLNITDIDIVFATDMMDMIKFVDQYDMVLIVFSTEEKTPEFKAKLSELKTLFDLFSNVFLFEFTSTYYNHEFFNLNITMIDLINNLKRPETKFENKEKAINLVKDVIMLELKKEKSSNWYYAPVNALNEIKNKARDALHMIEFKREN